MLPIVLCSSKTINCVFSLWCAVRVVVLLFQEARRSPNNQFDNNTIAATAAAALLLGCWVAAEWFGDVRGRQGKKSKLLIKKYCTQ